MAAPIYDIEQFVADPHVQQLRIIVDVPDDEIGSVIMHNVIPPRLAATPCRQMASQGGWRGR